MQTPQNQGSQLNYEELGAEVAKLNHDSVHQAAAKMTAPGAAAAINIPQVCDIYKKVKPFLSLIGRIPFIPAGIKSAINAFMGAMDLLCP
jgi:hypothetical protein